MLFLIKLLTYPYFKDSASIIFDGIIDLYNYITFYQCIILVLVIILLSFLLQDYKVFTSRHMQEWVLLELIWTISPALILIIIAFPSLRLLYLADDLLTPDLTVKVIGHQWYWSYNIKDIEFDSYMVNTDLLNIGDLRNLEVDEYLILPNNTIVRFLITSTDVIHSWSIADLGIKMDAIPGRLNQFSLETYRPGLYYGQCTEICGQNHPFMPIVVKII